MMRSSRSTAIGAGGWGAAYAVRGAQPASIPMPALRARGSLSEGTELRSPLLSGEAEDDATPPRSRQRGLPALPAGAACCDALLFPRQQPRPTPGGTGHRAGLQRYAAVICRRSILSVYFTMLCEPLEFHPPSTRLFTPAQATRCSTRRCGTCRSSSRR